MVNQDIFTALKNAVDRGESIDTAMQIMIHSGYNPREVEEASRFFSGNFHPNTIPQRQSPYQQVPSANFQSQQNPENQRIQGQFPPIEQPTISPIVSNQQNPQNARTQQSPYYRSGIQQPSQPQTPQPQSQIQPKPLPVQQLTPIQSAEQIKQKINPNVYSPPATKPIAPELAKIHPQKPSHFKEIILLIILLILIGVLIGTIFFKDTILKFLSG